MVRHERRPMSCHFIPAVNSKIAHFQNLVSFDLILEDYLWMETNLRRQFNLSQFELIGNPILRVKWAETGSLRTEILSKYADLSADEGLRLRWSLQKMEGLATGGGGDLCC